MFGVSASLAACGGGGGSSADPTVTPTPSPAPQAVVVTTSPSPLTLSVSGTGAPKTGTVAATQNDAAGIISLSTTGSTACFDSASPSAADLTQQNNTTQNLAGGVAQLGFSLTALNAGSCSISIVPATGSAVTITVTVKP